VSSTSAERQSARMSKITNNGLTRSSGKECFIAVPIMVTGRQRDTWHLVKFILIISFCLFHSLCDCALN